MADTLQFDLVSPERMLASVPASEVQVPGAEGDFTAMPGHAPLLSTLRPGIVTAATPQGEVRYVVTGGFVEVTAGGVSLLAESGVPAGELNQSAFDAILSEARKTAAAATGEAADAAAKRVGDIVAIGQNLGLSVPAA